MKAWTPGLHYRYNCDKNFQKRDDEEQFCLAKGFGPAAMEALSLRRAPERHLNERCGAGPATGRPPQSGKLPLTMICNRTTGTPTRRAPSRGPTGPVVVPVRGGRSDKTRRFTESIPTGSRRLLSRIWLGGKISTGSKSFLPPSNSYRVRTLPPRLFSVGYEWSRSCNRIGQTKWRATGRSRE